MHTKLMFVEATAMLVIAEAGLIHTGITVSVRRIIQDLTQLFYILSMLGKGPEFNSWSFTSQLNVLIAGPFLFLLQSPSLSATLLHSSCLNFWWKKKISVIVLLYWCRKGESNLGFGSRKTVSCPLLLLWWSIEGKMTVLGKFSHSNLIVQTTHINWTVLYKALKFWRHFKWTPGNIIRILLYLNTKWVSGLRK